MNGVFQSGKAQGLDFCAKLLFLHTFSCYVNLAAQIRLLCRDLFQGAVIDFARSRVWNCFNENQLFGLCIFF